MQARPPGAPGRASRKGRDDRLPSFPPTAPRFGRARRSRRAPPARPRRPGREPAPAPAGDGFVLVTSANGLEAAKVARQALIQGKDPLDAAIAGVNVVELDPDDVTVGYGGIPNEEGVVELDAAVMDGRTMRAGAVAALTGVKTPSKVARLVMERTDRVFLVGAGRAAFRDRPRVPRREPPDGEVPEDLAHWKNRLSDLDDWIEAARDAEDPDVKRFLEKYGSEDFRPQGTIHMSVRSAKGDLAASRRRPASSSRSPGASATPPSSAPASTPRTASAPPDRRGGARRTSSPAARTRSSSSSATGSPPRRRA